MNNTFYLKYRSQTFNELDIKEVRESLTKIVKSGKIPHAFLFAGPKGTGKTSAARILAKVVNCEKPKEKGVPCNKCDQCKSITNGNNIDVIELDAASNRGIDDIRALREAVKLAPAKAKRKVYIIDEAHMLTLEASNALLKTLEEPPEHVIFILATTNPEKLIETIRSRTTNINFRKAAKEEIIESLRRIIKGEKIKIDNISLDLIAQKAAGSFRDAAKILEQLVTEKISLKEDSVKKYLSLSFETDIDLFTQHLAQKDVKKLIDIIEITSDSGTSIGDFLGGLMDHLKNGLLEKYGIGEEKVECLSREQLIKIIDIFSEAEVFLKTASIEQLPLEIAVIKWCEEFDQGKIDNSEEKKRVEKKKEEKVNTSKKVVEEKEKDLNLEESGIEVNEESWRGILAKVRPINATIEALLRATKPICIDGNVLKLGVFYKFHKERLEDVKNRRIFEDVITEVFGRPIKLVCTLTEPPTREEKEIVNQVDVKQVLTEDGDKDIIKVAEEIFSS